MKDEKLQIAAPVCPNCGRVAEGTTQHNDSIQWNCWDCRTRSWDDKPMVSRSTLMARGDAHRAFDPLWQQKEIYASEAEVRKLLARSKAYKLLAEELGLPEKDVHMGGMSEEVAKKVPAAVERIKLILAKRTHEEIKADYRERGKEIWETRKRSR